MVVVTVIPVENKEITKIVLDIGAYALKEIVPALAKTVKNKKLLDVFI